MKTVIARPVTVEVPQASNGYAEIKDAKGNHVATCFVDGLDRAIEVAKAINAMLPDDLDGTAVEVTQYLPTSHEIKQITVPTGYALQTRKV
jgi:hypothetical protein